MAYFNGRNNFLVALKGDSAFIRYSYSADGSNFTETWSEGQIYMGVATGATAPTDKSEYTWVRICGGANGEAESGQLTITPDMWVWNDTAGEYEAQVPLTGARSRLTFIVPDNIPLTESFAVRARLIPATSHVWFGAKTTVTETLTFSYFAFPLESGSILGRVIYEYETELLAPRTGIIEITPDMWQEHTYAEMLDITDLFASVYIPSAVDAVTQLFPYDLLEDCSELIYNHRIRLSDHAVGSDGKVALMKDQSAIDRTVKFIYVSYPHGGSEVGGRVVSHWEVKNDYATKTYVDEAITNAVGVIENGTY